MGVLNSDMDWGIFWTAAGTIVVLVTFLWTMLARMNDQSEKAHREETAEFHARMEKKLDLVSYDVREIKQDVTDLKITTARQDEQLKNLLVKKIS